MNCMSTVNFILYLFFNYFWYSFKGIRVILIVTENDMSHRNKNDSYSKNKNIQQLTNTSMILTHDNICIIYVI